MSEIRMVAATGMLGQQHGPLVDIDCVGGRTKSDVDAQVQGGMEQ